MPRIATIPRMPRIKSSRARMPADPFPVGPGAVDSGHVRELPREFRPMSAPTPSADRNLLFGILALQMDFVPRDQLITAMNAWVLDKARPLGRRPTAADAAGGPVVS